MAYVIYNDLHLVPLYLFGLFVYLYTLGSMIYFHELGHKIYFLIKEIKTEKVWIRWGLETKIKSYITDGEHLTSLWIGVLLGLVPLVFSIFFFPPSVLLVVPYYTCIRYDISSINKLYNKQGKGFLGFEDD